VQSESREQILKTNFKTILILIVSIVMVSLFFFRNFMFKTTYLLKSFCELSVDPEIAFTNNKPTFLEFYAEWCEVWKEMAPQISAFKDEYEKDTYKNYSTDVLSAYSDNAAIISGQGKKRFYPDPVTREYKSVDENNNFCIKVETHNHPTAISPFSGAATGSGGEIRDEGATL